MKQQLQSLQGLYDLQQREPIKNPQQLIRSGDELYNAGNFKKALPIYHDLIKIFKKKSPTDSRRLEAYYKYATCLQESGSRWERADALRFYKHNIIPYSDPDSEMYKLSQAHIYYLEKQYKKALAIYKKIYQDHSPYDPNSIMFYNYIAKCLYEMKNYRQAQQYYKKIAQSSQSKYGNNASETKKAYNAIIKILLELEKYQEALPYIEKTIIGGESIDWILKDYPEIRQYLSPVFERMLNLYKQKFGPEDERVLDIVELYINNLFVTSQPEKAMQVFELYGYDKMLERLDINQFTLPLFMAVSERYFAERDISSLWSLAEKLDRRNFYNESKKIWQMIIECPDAVEEDIKEIKGKINNINEKIANEIIQSVLTGYLPASQLQKQQITQKDLVNYLSNKKNKNLKKNLKQKLVQLTQNLIQKDLADSSKYKKIKLLGSGSFGDVWTVKDQQGKKYAMKEARDKKQALIYESELLKQVGRRDPSPTNLKFVERTNKNELIMQYLDGFVTLDEYLESNTDRCNDIMTKLKRLVHNLHKNGIAHRDLKGMNIMIHPETEELRIIDFGVGCIKQNEKFACQTFRGATPNYYPGGRYLKTFQEWQKADDKALQIVEELYRKA
jgi:tRNA A-37 threonylcarbamoyl transferase component Bud32